MPASSGGGSISCTQQDNAEPADQRLQRAGARSEIRGRRRFGNADDGPSIAGVQPESDEPGAAGREHPAQHARCTTTSTTSSSASNRRSIGKWSLAASYAYRWNHDNANGYFGQNLRVRQDVANPERRHQHRRRPLQFQHVVGEGARHASKRPGVVRSRRPCACSPGQPYGRTILAGAANGINYGTQRILTEPIRHAPSGQHHPLRRPRGESLEGGQGADDCGCSSTATT